MIGGSEESRLRSGLHSLLDKADAKLEELQRWARVSFSLEVQEHGSSSVFIMQYCPDYSRKKDLLLPKFVLGFFPTAVVKNYEPCSQKKMKSFGMALQKRLCEFETEPPNSARKPWLDESYDGPDRRIVPAAVYGIACFQRIIDKDGVPYAPSSLHTYRTNDSESRQFLEKLVR